MKLSIRVGDTVADLFHFNRLRVEDIGGRVFLTGVRNSGRLFALFGVRPDLRPQVMEAINAALGSGRHVCVLSAECFEIDDDPVSRLAVEDHNRAAHNDNERCELPTTSAGSVVDVLD